MYLKRLKLVNFKNYVDFDIAFESNVNCLVGNNGVGKTNLLDAIYYLSFCKSYFNPLDSQNIHSGEQLFAIHGTYQSGDAQIQASCLFQNGQKKMRWDGKMCRSFAEHIGRVPLVMVSPNDQQMIIGGSDQRRKFVDGVISQVDRDYLMHLLSYQKALSQRNRLLKQLYEERRTDDALLAVWDDQLVQHGTALYGGRRAFLDAFTPLFEKYYRFLSRQTEQPKLRYVSQLELPEDYASMMRDNLRRDTAAQYTTVGPHKDDFDVLVGGFSVRRFGSQGQQKSVTLSLKLAQFDYIFRHFGIKPVLLLDDIFDKLDMQRISQLLEMVGGDAFGQVFLTDTQPGRIEQIFRQYPHIDYTLAHIASPPSDTK
ncbi:MAG: recF protein [bacterium P3]|nr:MAG: recF protein [bacterium P3]KWW41825.1 MAG: recF protein [bacterium F083]